MTTTVTGFSIADSFTTRDEITLKDVRINENQEYIKNTRDIVLTPHGQRAKMDLFEPNDP